MSIKYLFSRIAFSWLSLPLLQRKFFLSLWRRPLSISLSLPTHGSTRLFHSKKAFVREINTEEGDFSNWDVEEKLLPFCSRKNMVSGPEPVQSRFDVKYTLKEQEKKKEFLSCPLPSYSVHRYRLFKKRSFEMRTEHEVKLFRRDKSFCSYWLEV